MDNDDKNKDDKNKDVESNKVLFLESLRNKYDRFNIGALEGIAESALMISAEQLTKSIEILFYFERTKRFRENKQYENSSFNDYLKNRYAMAWHKYHYLRLAITRYPDMVFKYGIGVVEEAVRKCENPQKVLTIIDEKKADTKEIKEIIKKHKRPVKKKEDHTKSFETAIDKLKTRLKESDDSNKQMAGQIKKLKKTIEKYKEHCANCPNCKDIK